MTADEKTESLELKACHSCRAELIPHDRFCRRCGSQHENLSASSAITVKVEASEFETRPWSRPILALVTEQLSGRTSLIPSRGWEIQLTGLLIALPLWLMIILLSPLDAYVAAKSVSRVSS